LYILIIKNEVQLKGNNYTLAKSDIDVSLLKEMAEALQTKVCMS